MEALLNIFRETHEQGSEEWRAFQFMRNDMRPLKRFFKDSVVKRFIDDTKLPTALTRGENADVGPVSPGTRLAGIRESSYYLD